MNPDHIGFSWTINPYSGWGIYGYNIVRYLCLHTRITPVVLEDSQFNFADPLETEIVSYRTETSLTDNPDALERFKSANRALPFPVLHARGNFLKPQFAGNSLGVLGLQNHALTFIENSAVTPREVEIYNQFTSVVAGSTWNGDLLRDAGVRNVSVNLQGIDPAIFHPAPRREIFKNRFVIFSGGKMEFRKGQDIVLEAVRIFAQRHPETLLLNVWGNNWPSSQSYQQFVHSPYFDAPPPPDATGKLQLTKWFEAFGLGRQNIFAFPNYAHFKTPHLMREADVALFANRCEGGTNLVAMEAMACGIPTIISKNTGHLDIIHEGACLPLESQSRVTVSDPGFETAGWGESSVEEILEHLEFVYRNRSAAAEIGQAGARKMRELSWDRQAARLLSLIGCNDGR